MFKSDFDFSDRAVGAEERLADLASLYRGVVLAAEAFFRQVAVYHDMIEEELEGTAVATDYLERSRGAVESARACLHSAWENTVFSQEFEAIDVRVMLEGISRRCRRLLGTERALDLVLPDEDTVVNGALFQLQELFMDLFLWTVENAGNGGAGPVRVRVGSQMLDESFLRAVGGRCPAGQYTTFVFGADAPRLETSRLSPFWDTILEQGADSPFFHLGFLQLYGTVTFHGGDVFLDAREERPALVIVLPAKERIKGMQAAHNIPEQALMGSETILLVDDEDTIWDVIIDMLQELGYSVVLAANGREAVEIYRANPGGIDLVLLDMLMPELDGAQAFFELRKIDPSATILLSSGYISEQDVREVLDAGAAGFLQKPYRMVELAHKLRAILDAPERRKPENATGE
ncbi:MAG: response regulator [Kiritimatiellaeota bacterium]|nr:response regulator [Kiritimatiellota bacterium]